MPRVKNTKVTKKRRKKVLKQSKGYFGSKRTLYRTANEQVMRSMRYQYRDRKQRKRQFRKLWITRINAAAQLNGMKYSHLIHGLKLADVEINRKILADLAVHDEKAFADICNIAKEALKQEKEPKTKKTYDKIQPLAEDKPKAKKQEPKKEAKKAEPKKAEKKPEKKEEKLRPEQKDGKVAMDLSELTVVELKELCKMKGISGYSKLRKAELIALLDKQD